MKDVPVTYKPNGSDTEVKLSPSIVRNFLVSGKGNVSDFEVTMFIQLCRFQGLNPYLREAYLIKYSDNYPASIVVGKEAFTKRAEADPMFRGQQAGVIVVNKQKEVEERTGSFVLEGEEIVGGWAKVWKKDREVPYYVTVSYEEYEGRTSSGTVNRQWHEKPATMIRKVALVQALREAFPDRFVGMYDASEIREVDEESLPEKDVTPENESTEPEQETDASAYTEAEDAFGDPEFQEPEDGGLF